MKTLLVGYKAADLVRNVPQGEVTVHVLDIYHKHAIEKALPDVKVVCAPHLPEGPWDAVKFRTGPKLMSGELSLDLLQEIHLLKPAKFELDFVGRERERNELLDKIRNDPKRVRSFRATWPASVPGGEKLTFCSYPGCFCHRRLDEGGLALAEVVTKELSNLKPRGSWLVVRDSWLNIKPQTSNIKLQTSNLSPQTSNLSPQTSNIKPQTSNLKLLDMGCGCGLVGLLIVDRIRKSIAHDSSLVTPHLTMIDSHSRAIEAAKENAAAFGIEAEVVMADDGIDRLEGAKNAYDVFVGNPPYYSDYRIADVFLDAAKKALKPGGVCYTVCKNAAGLEPVQRRYFPDVEIIKRRSYAILKSTSPAS